MQITVEAESTRDFRREWRRASVEVTMRVGRLAKMLLFEHRDEGKVIQRKGYAKDGRVSYIYKI